MKITLLCIGKTDESYLQQGIEKYQNRLKHYIDFKVLLVPDIKRSKHLTVEQQKSKEADLLLKHIQSADHLVLLDEKGKELTSIGFSAFIEKKMITSVQHLVFVIGGPYGFDERLYQRTNAKLALSQMTFSHQMIRLFFIEQLYRAFTIQRNEPYHHE